MQGITHRALSAVDSTSPITAAHSPVQHLHLTLEHSLCSSAASLASLLLLSYEAVGKYQAVGSCCLANHDSQIKQHQATNSFTGKTTPMLTGIRKSSREKKNKTKQNQTKNKKNPTILSLPLFLIKLNTHIQKS